MKRPRSTLSSSKADMPTEESFKELFLAMAEELKLPLQYIARQAELRTMQLQAVQKDAISSTMHSSGTQACLKDILTSADMSLQLLDSYLLSLRLSLDPAIKLELEPVSVSAVLYDTASQLQDVA